jgi:large subunit ribosomal protein L15
MKGQKARTGGSRGLKRLAMQQFFRRIPKTGGFSRADKALTAVTLGAISKAFVSGATVTPATLAKKGLVPFGVGIKIINSGTLKHSITVRRCRVSAGAKEAITKAGGTVVTS